MIRNESSIMESFKSPKERELQQMRAQFRSSYIKPVENPVKSMEMRMRLLPPDTIIPQHRVRISERFSNLRSKENSKQKASRVLIDEEDESTSVGNEYVDLDAKNEERSEIIESHAFKNSIFHPEFEAKLMKK